MSSRDRLIAMSDAAAVGLELGFAGAPRADAAAEPRQRGARRRPAAAAGTSSCASSTCSLPSRVRARRAKMSRISCVRSMTLRSTRLLDVAQLRRRQLVVEDDDVDVGLVAGGRERLDLAAAEKRRRIGLRPLLQHAQHDVRAGRPARPASSSSESFRIESDASGRLNSPTSAARSRPLGRRRASKPSDASLQRF